MIINIKDILTLSDNFNYVVISKIYYNNNNYYYLIDKENNQNIKYCYEDNQDLIELNDQDLITKFLPLFLNAALKEL